MANKFSERLQCFLYLVGRSQVISDFFNLPGLQLRQFFLSWYLCLIVFTAVLNYLTACLLLITSILAGVVTIQITTITIRITLRHRARTFIFPLLFFSFLLVLLIGIDKFILQEFIKVPDQDLLVFSSTCQDWCFWTPSKRVVSNIFMSFKNQIRHISRHFHLFLYTFLHIHVPNKHFLAITVSCNYTFIFLKYFQTIDFTRVNNDFFNINPSLTSAIWIKLDSLGFVFETSCVGLWATDGVVFTRNVNLCLNDQWGDPIPHIMFLTKFAVWSGPKKQLMSLELSKCILYFSLC